MLLPQKIGLLLLPFPETVRFRASMSLELCPARKADAEAVTRLFYDAYQDENPVSKLMYPIPASKSIIAATLDLNLKSWGQDPTERRMQVKDSHTGELISYSSWFFCSRREGLDWKKIPEAQFPEGWYHENALAFEVKHIEARNKIMGPDPYICTALSTP